MKTLIAIILISAFACSSVKATATDPPGKMDTTSAAQLDAAMAHLKELASLEQGYIKTIQAVCTQYKIDPQQIGRSVNIDYVTGNITRAPQPVPPSVKDASATKDAKQTAK